MGQSADSGGDEESTQTIIFHFEEMKKSQETLAQKIKAIYGKDKGIKTKKKLKKFLIKKKYHCLFKFLIK